MSTVWDGDSLALTIFRRLALRIQMVSLYCSHDAGIFIDSLNGICFELLNIRVADEAQKKVFTSG
jgi:hypothetical protein